jgi:hypothetical protein
VRHLQHPNENGTPHYQTTRDLCNNAEPNEEIANAEDTESFAASIRWIFRTPRGAKPVDGARDDIGVLQARRC